MPTMNEYFIQESVECAGARCGPPYPAEPQTRSLFAWVRENMTHIRNLPVPADSFHADSVITFKDGASATVLVSWLEDFAAVAAGEKCPRLIRLLGHAHLGSPPHRWPLFKDLLRSLGQPPEGEPMKVSTQTATYARDQCAPFMRPREKHGQLSNMTFGYPLSVNGIDFQGARGSLPSPQVSRKPRHPEGHSPPTVRDGGQEGRLRDQRRHKGRLGQRENRRNGLDPHCQAPTAPGPVRQCPPGHRPAPGRRDVLPGPLLGSKARQPNTHRGQRPGKNSSHDSGTNTAGTMNIQKPRPRASSGKSTSAPSASTATRSARSRKSPHPGEASRHQ